MMRTVVPLQVQLRNISHMHQTQIKVRKVSVSSISDSTSLEPIQKVESLVDEENSKKNGLSKHFDVLQDITENEKLTKDLALTVSSIRSYEEYKWQKKKNRKLLDVFISVVRLFNFIFFA